MVGELMSDRNTSFAKNMKLGMKPAILFVLALLIIAGIGVRSYSLILQLIESNRWGAHTHQEIESLERVISAFKDAETGQRGFILTGDDRYLEPYNSAIIDIPKVINSASSLTKDNPQQQASLLQLEKLSSQEFEELEKSIKFRKDVGMKKAVGFIRANLGKQIMDEIRALVDQMQVREQQLLEARTRAAAKDAIGCLWIVAIGVLLSLLFIGIAAIEFEKGAKALIESQIALERGKRLSDMGVLAATVAHELRNPLATISLVVYNIKMMANNPDIEKCVATIDKKIAESDQIINNLLFYSHLKPSHYEKVNIFNILEECAIEDLKRHCEKDTIVIKELDSIKDVFIEADPTQIIEVFHNLLNNAHDAVPSQKGQIKIVAENEGEFAKVTIEDNGPGIGKNMVDKIFEPFFTTKAKGTGLGLAVCQQIIGNYGGRIEVNSKLGQGASFVVYLPKRRREA